MSQDYVQKKSLEALEATSGNRREAGLLLRVWSESDEKLKGELIAPFLNNLCALAIQRASSRPEGRRQAKRDRQRADDDAANLLSAITSRPAASMTSTHAPVAPPPPASSVRHRQAVATLAAAFQSRTKPGSQ